MASAMSAAPLAVRVPAALLTGEVHVEAVDGDALGLERPAQVGALPGASTWAAFVIRR